MSSHGYDRVTGENFTSRSEVIAAHGMVASSHPLATQIGLGILKQGGSAVDAAIAVNAALGLMDPCLLYTSPRPRDATLSRMPSSA